MVSITAWWIGSTALITLILSIFIGLYFIYKSKKLNAKLLIYAGIIIISTGLFYLGASIDFLMLIFTNNNLVNTTGIHGLLSFTSVSIAVIAAMKVGSELLTPNKTKIIIVIYIVLGIIFELFLYLDASNAFDFVNNNPGEDLIDSSFVVFHPTFILIVFFLLSTLIFCGIGFLIKAHQSAGKFRLQYYLLGLGLIIFVICGALDALVAPGLWLILIRFGMIAYAWLLYFGLTTTKI